MGAHHSTAGTTGAEPNRDDVEFPMDQHSVLMHYKVEHRLFPGSGRMMKTYQLKHKTNEATAVVKAMWVDVSQLKQQLQEQHDELQRIQTALSNQPHVAPFTYWVHQTEFFASAAHNLLRQRQPVYLLRPHVYTTLSDRLASRPFFTAIEKLWMVHQLLQALHAMHQHKVCHGFLTTENVGLTSWNWVVLLDISSYKAHTQLPDDDPSEYLYYFQDHHHQQESHSTTPHASAEDDDANHNNSNLLLHANNSMDTTSNANIMTSTTTTTSHGGSSGATSTTAASNKKVSRNREKRCYIAPERFISQTMVGGIPADATTTTTTTNVNNNHNTHFSKYNQLTPAMDIFSAGCVIMELMLNGDRALDLGDLLEYRQRQSSSSSSSSSSKQQQQQQSSQLSSTLQQKLHKIESSALRAACKHMLHVDPSARLSARAYLERLQAAEAIPQVMETCLEPLMEVVSNPNSQSAGTTTSSGTNTTTTLTPDARVALAALQYDNVLWETCGIRDPQGSEYLKQVLGHKIVELEMSPTGDDSGATDPQSMPKKAAATNKPPSDPVQDLFAETEALLKKLESLALLDDNDTAEIPITDPVPPKSATPSTTPPQPETAPRSALCKSSLLIYLQLIMASIRHVRRPASKLVALQMLTRLCDLCDSDEIRLQRMVPVSISLLQDQDSLVRASALKFLAHVVSQIQSFPPSDSKVFPQYIFKRVSPLLTDPSLVVRLAFCQSIAVLAETAQRFLDISHAVRLYEAIGAGSSTSTSVAAAAVTASSDQGSSTNASAGTKKSTTTAPTSPNVFSDETAKLLGDDPPPSKKDTDSSSDTSSNQGGGLKQEGGGFHDGNLLGSSPSGKTLINSNYQEELASLQETVSAWVIHITTDFSEYSSPTKRALLDSNLSRLCTFFGLEGVMAFILPQVLAFLNDRKDAQLRADLFCHLPSVCRIVGRSATEHFVLPCLESGLVDGEEQVVGAAIRCLAELIELGLLSRSVLLGNLTVSSTPDSMVELASDGLLRKYGSLLVHPSAEIRHGAIATINASCAALGSPDSEVYVAHLLHPFFRFLPSLRHLQTMDGMEACLYPSWSRVKFDDELAAFIHASQQQTGPWTSIGITATDSVARADGQDSSGVSTPASGQQPQSGSGGDVVEAQVARVREYLRMLGRRIKLPASGSQSETSHEDEEGRSHVLKNGIEGSLKLAQNIKFPRQDTIGVNKRTLPSWYSSVRDKLQTMESTTSETSAIRSVSALGEIYGLSIMAASDSSADPANATGDEVKLSEKEIQDLTHSRESKVIEGVCSGEWGSETGLDPILLDTSLLITKLKALNVPPLPPRLGELTSTASRPAPSSPSPRESSKVAQAAGVADWRPKADTLLATSSAVTGHTAPVVRITVSLDQNFFVSGSYDGSCRVWQLDQIETSSGVLESSITYTGHHDGQSQNAARINDVAMVEGSHSVVSAASNGSVHVWRVDSVSQKRQPSQVNTDLRGAYTRSRVIGTSEVRQIDPQEGEILAVSHFNSSSASIVTFASQKGSVHSWDLRSSVEPFVLKHGPDIGYLTSMALGTDRNWLLTGTSRGFLALWDLRFNANVKLWHNSRTAPITRLATSFVPPPQLWGSRNLDASDLRPYVFAACGPNECAMFDVTTGDCSQCFRTVGYGSHSSHAYAEDIPTLQEVPISAASMRRSALMTNGFLKNNNMMAPAPVTSINAMCGSIGVSDHSYLITGGGDTRIRFWDFAVPSKCFAVSGQSPYQPRPSFERIDLNGNCRLMLCRQLPGGGKMGGASSSRLTKKLGKGLSKPENHHTEPILDLKIVNKALISASRDCTVKVWR